MEGQASPALAITAIARAEVDTSRPFRSVKEAVAVFGERFLTGDTYARRNTAVVPKPVHLVSASKPIYAIAPVKSLYSASSSPRSYSSSSSRFNPEREEEVLILNSIKKLEAELEETRRGLKLLEERESETEVLVAALNTELHKSLSKLAEIEATGGVKAANKTLITEDEAAAIRSERWGEERTGFEYLPSLAEALNLSDMDDTFGKKRKPRPPKKKPIVPLISDLFSKKKGSVDFDNAFYNRPFCSTLS